MKHDEVKILLNETIDILFRQREIISELTELVNSADANEKVLAALKTCLKSLDIQEDIYKNLFVAFETAAYSKAVEHFQK